MEENKTPVTPEQEVKTEEKPKPPKKKKKNEWEEKFNAEQVELFYDFSCFLLHSFLAPCDAVYLHEINITNRNTIQI